MSAATDQPAAEGLVELEVELSLDEAELVLAEAALLASDDVFSPAIFFLSPVLKSVSYQPPPLRRNATAETFFFNSARPQAGQSRLGSSLIFCRASSSCWQLWHWYSYIGIKLTRRFLRAADFTALLHRQVVFIGGKETVPDPVADQREGECADPAKRRRRESRLRRPRTPSSFSEDEP